MRTLVAERFFVRIQWRYVTQLCVRFYSTFTRPLHRFDLDSDSDSGSDFDFDSNSDKHQHQHQHQH